ncbi:hypothetical protein U1Q18_001283 [Sarracenia purpurea var. burkii]
MNATYFHYCRYLQITVSTYEIQIGGDLRWLWFRRGGVDGGGGRDAREGRRRRSTGGDEEDDEPEIAIGGWRTRDRDEEDVEPEIAIGGGEAATVNGGKGKDVQFGGGMRRHRREEEHWGR